MSDSLKTGAPEPEEDENRLSEVVSGLRGLFSGLALIWLGWLLATRNETAINVLGLNRVFTLGAIEACLLGLLSTCAGLVLAADSVFSDLRILPTPSFVHSSLWKSTVVGVSWLMLLCMTLWLFAALRPSWSQ